jgi:hypothetical protein
VASGRTSGNPSDVVIATHRGTITRLQPDQWGGLWVEISGSCSSFGNFRSWHVHFDSFNSNISLGTPGNIVNRGTVLGIMGQTGLAHGPHDHYEFVGNNAIRMEPPYLPITSSEALRLRGCVGYGSCQIFIP